MKTRIFLKVLGLAAGVALGAASTVVMAQGSYPSRPVRMVVPFPAGSATDMAARIMAQQLQGALGQSFMVENKPGAGGSIAAIEVIRARREAIRRVSTAHGGRGGVIVNMSSYVHGTIVDVAGGR